MVDLNRTSLRVDNTVNKMLSLKNLQFMEARVHDETDSNINTAAKINSNNTMQMPGNGGNLVSYLMYMYYVCIIVPSKSLDWNNSRVFINNIVSG